MKGNKLASKELTNRLKAAINTGQALTKGLTTLMITKKGSIAKIKGQLLEAAGHYKESMAVIGLCKALSKA